MPFATSSRAQNVCVEAALLQLLLRRIQALALQILEFREMIRPQGLAHSVVLGKPAPQIHQFAALGAERPHGRAEEFGHYAANRTRNMIRGGHLQSTFTQHLQA